MWSEVSAAWAQIDALYTQLNNMEDDEERDKFQKEVVDKAEKAREQLEEQANKA